MIEFFSALQMVSHHHLTSINVAGQSSHTDSDTQLLINIILASRGLYYSTLRLVFILVLFFNFQLMKEEGLTLETALSKFPV